MDRDISPPPVKRRKLATTSTPLTPAHHPQPPSDPSQPSDIPAISQQTRLPSLRLFSWNINGVSQYLPAQSTKITSFFQPSDPDRLISQPTAGNSLRLFLARHDWPEVLFLQELKIRQGDTKTLAALLSALNTPLNADDVLTDGRAYTLDAVLPRDKYNARGFGGRLYGVGTVLRTDFAREHVASVRDVEWDLEGRVSVVELKSSPTQQQAQQQQAQRLTTTATTPAATPTPTPTPTTPHLPTSGHSNSSSNKAEGETRPLALLNIYAINGTSAAYLFPTTGRPIANLTRHDHKRAFHTRLRDECLALEARGFAVVVAGDLNVARGPWDGYPRLRTWPRVHCVSRADFNGKFFGRGDCLRAGVEGAGGDGGGRGGVGWKGGGLQDGKRGGVQDYGGVEVGGGRDGGGDKEGDGDGGLIHEGYDATGEEKGGIANGRERGGNEACLDAVDVFRAMYGPERRYTYYPRTREWGTSCDRVDMIFVSKTLWEAGRVLGTGILDTPQERGLSDHVPLWVEVALNDQVGDGGGDNHNTRADSS